MPRYVTAKAQPTLGTVKSGTRRTKKGPQGKGKGLKKVMNRLVGPSFAGRSGKRKKTKKRTTRR